MATAILIDGYNLLHVTEVFARRVGPGSVEQLHRALIDFLASALDPADVPRTTIVFDAKGRHAGTRRVLRYREITVHYAARDEDADTLLAELIRDHTSPRRLVVVSSDHQVQRSARRRRAKAVDSDVWYAELRRRQRTRQSAEPESRPVPADPATFPDDVVAQAEQEPPDGHPFPPGYLEQVQRELLSGDSEPPRPPDRS